MQSPAFSSLPLQVCSQHVGGVRQRLLVPASVQQRDRSARHSRTGRQSRVSSNHRVDRDEASSWDRVQRRDVRIAGFESIRMLTRMLPKAQDMYGGTTFVTCLHMTVGANSAA